MKPDKANKTIQMSFTCSWEGAERLIGILRYCEHLSRAGGSENICFNWDGDGLHKIGNIKYHEPTDTLNKL